MRMIIPTAANDYKRVYRDFSKFFKFIPIEKIVFIGPAELQKYVEEDALKQNVQDRVSFLNENEILSFDLVEECIKRRVAREGYVLGNDAKLGWYYQQFLKMSYCYLCEDEYYMTWDADTLPVHKIDLFNGRNMPYFNVIEGGDAWFLRTAKTLLGYERSIEKSFISENMIFNVSRMKELIKEIENTDLFGETYYEKIFNAVNIKDIRRGFSEFETYGIWMTHKYPEEYALRSWTSLRMGGAFFDAQKLNDEDREWLSIDYDAITYESYHPLIQELEELFHDKRYREKLTPKQMYEAVIESDYFSQNETLSVRTSDDDLKQEI